MVLPVITLVSGHALAQQVPQPTTWQENVSIDRRMDVLAGPVWQPLHFDERDRPGVPSLPLYKQQPTAAQRDFRPTPAPVTLPPAVPVPVSGGGSPQPTPPSATPALPSQPPPSPPPDQAPENPQPPPPNPNPCPIHFFDPNCF
jgi:hypothetical protein